MYTLYAHCDGPATAPPDNDYGDHLQLPLRVASAPDLANLKDFAALIGLGDRHLWLITAASGQVVAESETAASYRALWQKYPGSRHWLHLHHLSVAGRTETTRLVDNTGETVLFTWSFPSDSDPGGELTLLVTFDGHDVILSDFITAKGSRLRSQFDKKHAALNAWWKERRARGWPASLFGMLCDGSTLPAELLVRNSRSCAGPPGPDSPLMPLVVDQILKNSSRCRGLRPARTGDPLRDPTRADAWLAEHRAALARLTTPAHFDDMFEAAAVLANLNAVVGTSGTVIRRHQLEDALAEIPLGELIARTVRKVSTGELAALPKRLASKGQFLLFPDGNLDRPVNYYFRSLTEAGRAGDCLGTPWIALRIDTPTGGAETLASSPGHKWTDRDLAILVAAAADPALRFKANNCVLQAGPEIGWGKDERPRVTPGFTAYYTRPGREPDLAIGDTGRAGALHLTTELRQAWDGDEDELAGIVKAMHTRCLTVHLGDHPGAELAASDPRWREIVARVTTMREATGLPGAPGHLAGCTGDTRLTGHLLALIHPDTDHRASLRDIACDCRLADARGAVAP